MTDVGSTGPEPPPASKDLGQENAKKDGEKDVVAAAATALATAATKAKVQMMHSRFYIH